MGLAQNTNTEFKELVSRHVNISSDHRTEQLKRKLSHLGQIVIMNIENEFVVDSSASHHTMSKKVTSGEDTNRRSK